MSTEREQKKSPSADDPSKINEKRNVELGDEELGKVSGGTEPEEEELQA